MIHDRTDLGVDEVSSTSGSAPSPRPRRRGLVVAIVIVVALVAAAVVAATIAMRSSSSAHAGDLTGARVNVIGDSLTKASVTDIRADLTAAGYQAGTVDGINGQDIITRRDALLQAGQPGVADVLVIALGTNNAFFASLGDGDLRHRTMDDSLRDLDRVITEVDAAIRCIVWINVNDHTDSDKLSTWAPVLNQAIAARAEQENGAGRPMRVGDWATVSRDHPEYFLEDGIHLTKSGQQAYAALIRSSVDSCQ